MFAEEVQCICTDPLFFNCTTETARMVKERMPLSVIQSCVLNQAEPEPD